LRTVSVTSASGGTKGLMDSPWSARAWACFCFWDLGRRKRKAANMVFLRQGVRFFFKNGGKAAASRGGTGLTASLTQWLRLGLQKVGKILGMEMKTPSEWTYWMGQGGAPSVFQAGSWVYRTTPRPRGVFKAKICLLSPAYRMPLCHKAPTHTKCRISSPARFPFPGGGLGMARWCVPEGWET
jgi:hypothetical protein